MSNDRLRDAMMRKGLTPAILAEKIGVDPKTVERWMTQDRTPYPRHRREISVQLGESERYLWPEALSPERATQVARSEVVQLHPRRSAVPDDLWHRLLDQAQERIGILVYAGVFLVEQRPRLVETLKAKAAAGVTIEILLGDPTSTEIDLRSKEESTDGVMAAKIRQVMRYYERVRDVPGISVRFHNTTLYNSIYRFDDDMLVNTHVYGFPAPHAPVLQLRRLAGGDLFDTYLESFDKVRETSSSAWPAEVAR
ncbi:transcriptional regulator [Catellatospora sp. IY07-71]|uniref:XRE family transcriptional regulator n=1 Tax=Catellatospora sp. IY07-71 TaxID=2728827 RepID=UPI001BB32851|nr:XRE family transcriptional regulator [Catellatospora sp. IY07-71]BCJ74497.1 transcriptional regulator [Catellatospora sp. IY07-71]